MFFSRPVRHVLVNKCTIFVMYITKLTKLITIFISLYRQVLVNGIWICGISEERECHEGFEGTAAHWLRRAHGGVKSLKPDNSGVSSTLCMAKLKVSNQTTQLWVLSKRSPKVKVSILTFAQHILANLIKICLLCSM